jgi:PAS domain S-box-containing protein
MIVSLDAAGRVMTWNKAAERVLEYSKQEAAGKPFTMFFAAAEHNRLEDLFTRLRRDGDAPVIETALQTPSGRGLLISWRFSSMHTIDESVAIVGVGRDLTDKRHLEEQVIQSAKLAALGEMAGGIVHEIRNPLAIASSAAQILQKRGGESAIRDECAQKIRHAVTRATAILENLFRFTRPAESVEECVDVNSAVEDSLALVEQQFAQRLIEIQKRFTPGLPPVKGSRNQLQQAFVDIILNTYRAMPEGGRLVVESDIAPLADGDWIDIRFTDTGCGIPAAQLARIFDPFFSARPVGKGTGLGLSIAYSIVQRHGGTILVDSNPSGTIFIVRLPASGAKQEACSTA